MDKKMQVRKCIVLQVHPQFHMEIKTMAAMRDMSMSLLIHKAVYQYLRKEVVEAEKED
jgi:predicted DNA-binding ribbon-helix-helix protein